MTEPTDAEFEVLIHSDETHIELLETDDAKHLRDELAPPHAAEVEAPGELPANPAG